jgi:hypothetical protein
MIGSLVNLGHEVSDQTVGNVLRRHGIPPAPERKRRTTWAEFIRIHLALLAGTDISAVEVLMRGLVTCYVLFFIYLESSRIDISRITSCPNTSRWFSDWRTPLLIVKPETGLAASGLESVLEVAIFSSSKRWSPGDPGRASGSDRTHGRRESPLGSKAHPGRIDKGRVEERRGCLGHAATPRFLSPLIEPDVRLRIRLSDKTSGLRSRRLRAPGDSFIRPIVSYRYSLGNRVVPVLVTLCL